MILSVLAYVADVAILGTYAWTTRWPQRVRWFHAANAIGCLPVIAVELSAHAYPVLPLTATFGVLGAYGWLRLRTTRMKPMSQAQLAVAIQPPIEFGGTHLNEMRQS